jgi:hypothetical protein
MQGSASNVGIKARNSGYVIGDNGFFLGSSGVGNNQIFMTQGFAVKRVSNSAIESELGKMETTSDAVAIGFTLEGHTFYCISFITGNRTFVYDATTNQWCEWSTRTPLTNEDGYFEPLFIVSAFDGKLVCANGNRPYIMTLEVDKYQDFWDFSTEVPLIRERTSNVFWSGMRNVAHKELALDLETGVGLQTGQGEEPQIMLQYSNDGGHTWGRERWRNIGRIGEYKKTVKWLFLGSSRERVYRFRVSDPVKVNLLQARLETEVSNAR